MGSCPRQRPRRKQQSRKKPRRKKKKEEGRGFDLPFSNSLRFDALREKGEDGKEGRTAAARRTTRGRQEEEEEVKKSNFTSRVST